MNVKAIYKKLNVEQARMNNTVKMWRGTWQIKTGD
jgi:hypothetical protein